jgi:hypothetical protein
MYIIYAFLKNTLWKKKERKQKNTLMHVHSLSFFFFFLASFPILHNIDLVDYN